MAAKVILSVTSVFADGILFCSATSTTVKSSVMWFKVMDFVLRSEKAFLKNCDRGHDIVLYYKNSYKVITLSVFHALYCGSPFDSSKTEFAANFKVIQDEMTSDSIFGYRNFGYNSTAISLLFITGKTDP